MRSRWAGLVLGALVLVVPVAGCTSTVAGRAVPAASFREVPPSATATPSAEPTSSPGTTAPDPTGAVPAGSAGVCAVVERDVPATLDAVNGFVDAVTASPSFSLDTTDPAVTGAVSSVGATVAALDAAVAASGPALPPALARAAGALARSLQGVGAAITAPDPDAFNDGIGAVDADLTDAESHCRFA